jgi:hypothetical protein
VGCESVARIRLVVIKIRTFPNRTYPNVASLPFKKTESFLLTPAPFFNFESNSSQLTLPKEDTGGGGAVA